jgi:hypothetical protein
MAARAQAKEPPQTGPIDHADTKNPDYSDILYVSERIGPDVINTMPEQTLRAFADHGARSMWVPPRRRDAPVRRGRGDRPHGRHR